MSTITTYAGYSAAPSSEKLTLAVLHGSNRLMGWTLYSGSVYTLSSFDVASIVSIEDSGTAYTEVSSIAAVTAGKFYNDRDNKVLYLRASNSSNPNSRFLVLTRRLFFSNAPITLPHDLSTGYDVYWEPMIESTSQFGVEIDTINQTSEAIEGSGTLTLYNDQDFWPSNFDKLTFENKTCYIYSHNRGLDVTEAKLIFRGMVEKKTYNSKKIQFGMRDLLSELRAPVALSTIADLELRNASDLDDAKQRMIIGRVSGHRPVNVDAVLDGYPLSGTISVTVGEATIWGSSSAFLTEVAGGDSFVIGDTKYSVSVVVSDVEITISSVFTGTSNIVLEQGYIIPGVPKRYMNRVWCVAGHVVRQPSTTTLSGCSVTNLIVASTADMYDGDQIYVGDLGSGTTVTIERVVSSTKLKLATSMASAPASGVSVIRPSVQNVRLNDLKLQYYEDYYFDPSTAILTLQNDAEASRDVVRKMTTDLVFSSNRVVTGTNLNTEFKPGDLVGAFGQSDMFQVLSVDSDTQLTLTTNATYTATARGIYKNYVFDPDKDALTCDILGRTVDGLPSGALISTAPMAVKTLLIDAGLSSVLDTASFATANDVAYQTIGLVIPPRYSDTSTPTYREVINKLNHSVFGSLIQTDAFELSYYVLEPSKSGTALRLDEADILKFSVTSTADKVVKTTIVQYAHKEHDYLVNKDNFTSVQKTSDVSNYVLKTNRERTFDTILVNATDAEIYASRWAFILEYAAASVKLETKLQTMALEVGDIIDLTHRKMFERYGSTSARHILLVEKITKSGSGVSLEAVDLSNAFNRAANLTTETSTWAEADEDTRIYAGYITDSYGLIDNDADTFGLNLIW
jgi:hypothetical protein